MWVMWLGVMAFEGAGGDGSLRAHDVKPADEEKLTRRVRVSCPTSESDASRYRKFEREIFARRSDGSRRPYPPCSVGVQNWMSGCWEPAPDLCRMIESRMESHFLSVAGGGL